MVEGDVRPDVTILTVFQELKISGSNSLLLVMKEINLNDISLLTSDLPDQTS